MIAAKLANMQKHDTQHTKEVAPLGATSISQNADAWNRERGKIKAAVDADANEQRAEAEAEHIKSKPRDEKGRLTPGGRTSGPPTRRDEKAKEQRKTRAKIAQEHGTGVKAVRIGRNDQARRFSTSL